MARFQMLFLALILIFVGGCDSGDRISRLEKQNQELKAALERNNASVDYDLQAKCSKDARAWFNENWSSDKETVLLDFSNHYNKTLNKCFILVEYHHSLDRNGSWTNNMSLWDVYENAEYGNFSETHMTVFKPKFETSGEVLTCELLNRKCGKVAEFNELVQPYMNN